MLKVAVVLTGELRYIDFCYKWWQEVVKKSGFDVTFYSSTWPHLNNASVNDKVLMMQDSQDQILCHNFLQQPPKMLLDKIDQSNNSKMPVGGKCFPIPDKDKENQNKEIITDPDKFHLHWRI